MNSLISKYGQKGFTAIGFPCNQFGHQSNEKDGEFLNMLKHVRPGGGFEPKADIMAKVAVNGAKAHPLFKWMKTQIPIPQDGPGDSKGNGCDNVDALILPRGGFDGTTAALWSPVCRSDIAWNFEKFLLDKDGNLVKRYSRFYPTEEIGKDIEGLI